MNQPETKKEHKDRLLIDSECLVIFVKLPVVGKVKTRLGQQIGMANAVLAYRQIVEKLIENLANIQVKVVLAYSPPQALPEVKAWLHQLFPYPVEYTKQSCGDLGERLATAIRAQLDSGCRKVMVIGSDCPWVDTAIIERASQALETHEMVLGPTFDGGYYLLGMNMLPDDLLVDIPWSTDKTREATEAKAKQAGLACHVLDKWLHDIDQLEDYQLFKRSLLGAG